MRASQPQAQVPPVLPVFKMASMFNRYRFLGSNPSTFPKNFPCSLVSSRVRKTASRCLLSVVLKEQRTGFSTSCYCAGSPGVSQHTSVHPSLLGPSVRLLLESYGLDTNLVQPSGQKGQLLKGDVLKYIKENSKVPKLFMPAVQSDEMPSQLPTTAVLTEDAEYSDLPISNMRQTIARKVTESKTSIPHIYNTIECNMEKVLDMRRKLREDNIIVSVNDFIIKAVSLSLSRVPEVNSYWGQDGPVRHGKINIAVAIASPSGLTTPVINGVTELDVLSISSAVRDLSQRAKDGRLNLQELQEGTFTVSNLGMFGIKHFTAIIYPPQTAILAVGQTQVGVTDEGRPTRVMSVTLCCDGRVVDEPLSARWLEEFREIIENPLQMGL